MPLPAAIGLLLLATAILRRAESDSDGEATPLPFMAAALGMLFSIGIVSAQSSAELIEANRLVTHTYEVRGDIDTMVSEVARMESSARAQVLTGKESFLTRYDFHRSEVTRQLETLRRLVKDDPAQSGRAEAMRALAAEKFAQTDTFLRLRREQGAEVATKYLSDLPETSTSALVNLADAMKAEETRLLGERDRDRAAVERNARTVEVLGSLLALGLMSASVVTARRAATARQHAEEGLIKAKESLEQRVAERTQALVRTNEQLHTSEANYRFLADAMPQLVWTARPDGTIESVNQSWSAYLGIPVRDVIAALAEAVHPMDRPANEREWAGMLAGGRSGEGELRLRRHDGTYRWHLWRAHPQRDAVLETILRWVGTYTDIHDQKLVAERLEQRVAERTGDLRASEERFRSAFEFAGIGMALVGLDGRWLRVNKAICAIVGYTEEDLMRKTFRDITHPDDLNVDLANLRELVEGRLEYYRMEKRYLHRDGSIVWIHLTASLVRDAGGAPLHFVSQIEDISTRKRLEENLAHARDQALEATRLKSEFLANMSHEIRTPLNGVVGMIGLLLDTPLSGEQRSLANTARVSAEALLTVINDILDFSKIEAGQLAIESIPFDLAEPVENCLGLLAEKAHEKGVELAYLLEENVPTQLIGDSHRLRQVLLNLVSNAVKFTAQGEVVLRVTKIAEEQRQAELRFEVRDTGTGIPAEVQAKLFQPFVQADGSTTRRFGGTGLGLAICRQLVTMMGGRIGLQSEPGRGSTFWIELKFSLQEAAPKAVPYKPDLAGKRALIVDDNATNREILVRQLAAWRVESTAVETGEAALATLEAARGRGAPFHVGLLDGQMPVMGGLDLARTIRAAAPARDLKLVILTSMGHLPSRGELAAAGVDASLFKPARQSQLRETLVSLLAATGSAESSGEAPVLSPQPRAEINLRILVAEDNPVNQHVARLQLEKFGYRPDLVVDGLQAVAAVQAQPYDIVMMDCQMPELDGFEATRRIRTWEAERRAQGLEVAPLHIIAMTANAMVGDREECLAAGMDDYLTKPVRQVDLAAALARSPVAQK